MHLLRCIPQTTLLMFDNSRSLTGTHRRDISCFTLLFRIKEVTHFQSVNIFRVHIASQCNWTDIGTRGKYRGCPLATMLAWLDSMTWLSTWPCIQEAETWSGHLGDMGRQDVRSTWRQLELSKSFHVYLDVVGNVIVDTLSSLGRNLDFHTGEFFLSKIPYPAGWVGAASIFLDDFNRY